ncbi:TonB-dependent siderophore receptor [Chitinasiproducens palmae]|uniref:Outer-membrane receptor for ferric coprogen and ferric-rhodotorulic acid n=1 Tax=Chitinasiproducens palmae TaxID=1770053 RepID=A0A1H2PKF1_9BURK|nr:TonB-dependent siderophore receptor [Chitinasiproducens palmae]SDV46919.1 outer-membrane receptor for ferric coprogen and ferric-rhodotorulic acid [Chitinasiproducens palmae]
MSLFSIRADIAQTARAVVTASGRPYLLLLPVAAAVLSVWSVDANAQIDEPASLPEVKAQARRTLDATSEGNGSYTSNAATVAGKTATDLLDVPDSVSVVTRERMNDQNMTTVEEALRYATGVTAVTYGDSTAYYTARGYPVGIEFDGIAIASGLQYQPQFDLAFYDRAEVFRGPAGLLDGTGEPGGTVNLVRKAPADTFHLESETMVGSWSNYRQMLDVTGPLTPDGALRGRAVVVAQDRHFNVDHSRSKKLALYGALAYDFSPRTTLTVSAAHQVNTLPAFDYGQSLYTDGRFLAGDVSQNYSPSWNYGRTSMQEANANLIHRFDNGWTAQATVFYRHLLNTGTYAYAGGGVDPDTNLVDYSGQAQRMTTDWFGVDVHTTGTVELFGRRHTLLFGADYQSVWTDSLSAYQDLGYFDAFAPDTVPQANLPFDSHTKQRLEQFGVYGQARVQLLDRLTLVLGGREAFMNQQSQSLFPTVEDWSVNARVNHKFIPYAGLVYRIMPDVSVYGSYTKIFAPQTQTTYDGNALRPRSGEQYEVGVKGRFLDGRLNATVAAFRINDTGRAVADPAHATGSVAAGEARSQGWEAELSGNLTPNWSVYAGYTLLNTRYESDPYSLGQTLDGEEPRHLFKLWTSYRLAQGALEGVRIGGGVRVMSSTYRTPEAVQGGYALFDAQLGYRFNRYLDATLSVNNIFDRRYYARVPSSYFGITGDPRNVLLTLRASY